MCLAIYKPAGKSIERASLCNGFQYNSDGAGFAYLEDGNIILRKGFFTFLDFWDAYQRIGDDKQMLIHFRWKTHGFRDKDNCHPFRIGGDYAVVHNGILDIKTDDTPSKSDTWHYVNRVLAPILGKDPELFTNGALRYLICTSIGHSNKMVVLRKDGEVFIANESAGEWEDGVWFSNTSWKTWKTRAKSNYGHGCYGSAGYWQGGEWKSYYGTPPIGNGKASSFQKETKEETKAGTKTEVANLSPSGEAKRNEFEEKKRQAIDEESERLKTYGKKDFSMSKSYILSPEGCWISLDAIQRKNDEETVAEDSGYAGLGKEDLFSKQLDHEIEQERKAEELEQRSPFPDYDPSGMHQQCWD